MKYHNMYFTTLSVVAHLLRLRRRVGCVVLRPGVHGGIGGSGEGVHAADLYGEQQTV